MNVVRKEKSTRLPRGLIRKTISLIDRSRPERLKLSQFHMRGIGTVLLKKIMTEAQMPSVKEMITMDKELGVKFIACTTIREIMGVPKDDLIGEVDQVAGAPTYLAKAKESNINLFI